MPISVRHSGAWQVPAVSVKHSGTWKTPEQVYVRDGGLWVPLIDTASPPTTLTYITSGVTNVDAATIPATAQEGDLVVWARFGRRASAGGAGHPAGWTLAYGGNFDIDVDDYCPCFFAYKVLEAGEPGTSPTGYRSPLEQASNVMTVYRPDSPISAVAASGGNYYATAGNPPGVTIPATGAAAPAVAVGMSAAINSLGGGGGHINNDGSDGFDIDVGSTYIDFAAKVYNSGDTPASHTIDMYDEGYLNILMGVYMSVS